MKIKKKLSILLAVCSLAITLTACEKKAEQEQNKENNEQSSTTFDTERQTEGIVNPLVEYKTVEDAVIAVGHLSPTPEIYEKYDKKAFVISGKMIQIIYLNDSGEILTLREQAGESGDISGVYNDYAYNKTVEIEGNDVKLQGASGDNISVATWYDGAYGHSLFYKNGVKMDELTKAITDING